MRWDSKEEENLVGRGAGCQAQAGLTLLCKANKKNKTKTRMHSRTLELINKGEEPRQKKIGTKAPGAGMPALAPRCRRAVGRLKGWGKRTVYPEV